MEPALFVVAIIASTTTNAEAVDHAARAYIRQTKIDERLDEYHRRLLTDAQRRTIGNVAIVGRVLIEGHVSFRWEFP